MPRRVGPWQFGPAHREDGGREEEEARGFLAVAAARETQREATPGRVTANDDSRSRVAGAELDHEVCEVVFELIDVVRVAAPDRARAVAKSSENSGSHHLSSEPEAISSG